MLGSMERVQVKVCGVRTVRGAVVCVEAGVDAVGLNFWPGSPRCVDIPTARAIVRALPGVEVVAVFVDQDPDFVRRVRNETGIEWAQLHGAEAPADVAALLPRAYKALGVRDAAPLADAQRFPGARILLDTRVPGGPPGGTGARFRWDLALPVARTRELTIAGGITPANVAECVRLVRPHRVDVASGAESAPGVQDPAKVRALVRAVRAVG